MFFQKSPDSILQLKKDIESRLLQVISVRVDATLVFRPLIS